MTTRREFLRTGAIAGGAILAGCGGGTRIPDGLSATPRSQPRLRILVLGGTGFIGPHLVRHAVSRGHQVSIFTRGRRDAELPDGIERLVGDRAITEANPEGDLNALKGRTWDAVFDDSATDPRWVTASANVLKDSGRYMFVSSTGVFLPYLTPNNDENAPVLYDPPAGQQPQYGHNKARSERVTMNAFGDRGLVVRPGYIVGPGDTTDRFSYWPQRFQRGGEILVPGKKTDPSQFIDVRDLTAFMMKLVEDGRSGIHNATGPAQPLQWGDFIAEAHATLNPSATLTWVDDYAFLRSQRITYNIPWMIPEGNNAYHLGINNRKAVAAGLTFRPIATTLRDTLADWPNRLARLPQGGQPNFNLTPEREAAALAAWKAR